MTQSLKRGKRWTPTYCTADGIQEPSGLLGCVLEGSKETHGDHHEVGKHDGDGLNFRQTGQQADIWAWRKRQQSTISLDSLEMFRTTNIELTEQQQRSRNRPVNVSSVENLSQNRRAIGCMLERSNPSNTHTTGHDEVRRMSGNEDRTGNHVEKPELSFNSFGEDDGDDDAEGHDGENDPRGLAYHGG